VDGHDSETYFVLGEGLLGEAGAGRELAAAAGAQLAKPNRLKIALAMTLDNLAPGQIPAGFTYLGQFIDHDLTLDNTNLAENVDLNPATLTDAALPASTSTRSTGTALRRRADLVRGRFSKAVGLATS
jgi:hypothetical protein